MSLTPITLIIIALFVFWRGFTSGAILRSKEMLVAHGVLVEPTWLERTGGKVLDGICWCVEHHEIIIGIIFIGVILFVVGSVTYNAVF